VFGEREGARRRCELDPLGRQLTRAREFEGDACVELCEPPVEGRRIPSAAQLGVQAVHQGGDAMPARDREQRALTTPAPQACELRAQHRVLIELPRVKAPHGQLRERAQRTAQGAPEDLPRGGRAWRGQGEIRVHSPSMPRRRRYLYVCVNRRPDGTPKGSCAARGAVELHAALKEELKRRGLAELEARACTASCLDACWMGPVIAVEPDGYFLGRLGLGDVARLCDALERGERLEEHVLAPADYDEPKLRRD
jgi:(2Fe-2S) ferredoxin